MTESYLFNYQQNYYGLMTDWGLQSPKIYVFVEQQTKNNKKKDTAPHRKYHSLPNIILYKTDKEVEGNNCKISPNSNTPSKRYRFFHWFNGLMTVTALFFVIDAKHKVLRTY